MLLNRISRNFSFRHFAVVVAGISLIALTPGAGTHTVEARSGFIPIEIDPDGAMVANQSVPIKVVVSGGPVAIRVSSLPAGVVSYQGTVSSTQTILNLPVSASASGPVTLTLSVEGVTISSVASVAPARAY